jgi:hypothetical protein
MRGCACGLFCLQGEAQRRQFMATETLTYAQLSEKLNCSPDAAKALVNLLLRMTTEVMAAKEAAARLGGGKLIACNIGRVNVP